MGVIYQLTFFAALAILAILITIFVFAVSLLGRAMEVAASSEKEKLGERKEKNAKEMADIKKEIEEAEPSGQIPSGLTRKLGKLEKRNREFDRELAKIRRAPALLTVRGGVLPSSAPLLGALILTGAAWYLSTIENVIWLIPVIIWIVGLAAIGYSIFQIYHCLRVVESVAVTSEEVAERRLAQAVKVALVELEEEKKPKLALVFIDKQPPFHIKAGAQLTIEFGMCITQGDIARQTIVVFIAPPGFDFPGRETYLQPEGLELIGGHITTHFELKDCLMGITPTREMTIQAPSDRGTFSILYRLHCEGFPGSYEELEVVVE